MHRNHGINISGYINKQFGLGAGVRSTVRAVRAANIPHVLNDFNLEVAQHILDREQGEEISTEHPFSINLMQINTDMLPQVLEKIDPGYFVGKYNIAFWAWELEDFPESSLHHFKLFDEIWVPSNFCAEAIAKVSTIPVLKFMHTVEINEYPFSRKDLGIPEDRFVFLGMFDYYSSIDRKNPLGLIDAYEQAFGINDQNTLLILKSSIGADFPKERARIEARVKNNKSIVLIEEIMAEERLYSYMNCCDCFVSLHRSEGFGLTLAEAMYLGKPVIATGYSGNTDFMNVNNSFLVRYTMIGTGNQYSFVSGKGYWADPDINHAAEHMKFVIEHPEAAHKIAQRGREDALTHLSAKKIGDKMRSRLKLIETGMSEDFRNGQSSPKEAYLLAEIKSLERKVEKLRSYMPIKMKVAFKNFKNKVTGSNRKYDWE